MPAFPMQSIGTQNARKAAATKARTKDTALSAAADANGARLDRKAEAGAASSAPRAKKTRPPKGGRPASPRGEERGTKAKKTCRPKGRRYEMTRPGPPSRYKPSVRRMRERRAVRRQQQNQEQPA